MKKLSNRMDYLFFSACVVIIAISSMLLYSEYTERFSYERSRKAGIITYKEKVTRRKPQSEVIWEEIIKNSLIYIGDTVRTGEDSRAVVRLNDGTKVTMSRNTMIQFFIAEDKLNIDFSNGEISVTRTGAVKSGSRGINIKTRGKNIPADDSDIQIFETGKNVNIVLSGGTDAALPGSREYIIKDDESAVVTEDTGGIKSSRIITKLLQPERDKFFMTYSGSKEIGFRWESKSAENILEISRDRNFSNIAVRRNTSGSSAAVKLDPGFYYWRVKSATTGISSSKFALIRNSPVMPRDPSNNMVFTYVNKPPMIDYGWAENPLALNYILEISGDDQFRNIIKSIQTGENYISADLPGPGTYYWRVKIKTDFEEDEPPEYIIHKFNVTKTDKFEDIALLKPWDKSILVADSQADKKLIFSCREYNEIDFYKLIISKKENPGASECETVSKTNFMIPDMMLSEGEYLWRIEGFLQDGSIISKSGTRSLRFIAPGKLRVVFPENNSISAADEDPDAAKIAFSWTSCMPGGTYLIRLFNDDKMIYLFREETVNGSTVTIDKIKPGTYYWHVYLLDNNKNRIIVSDNSRFTVKKPLPAPGIIYPGNNIVIDILEKNNIEFSWHPEAEASLYGISLFRIEDNKENLLWKKETADNKIVIDNIRAYDIGDYVWTLQAFEMDDSGKKIIRNSRIIRNYLSFRRKLLDKPRIEKLEIK